MSNSKPSPEHSRELVLRFSAFLFRTVDEFPASGEPLGRAIGETALSLIQGLLHDEPRDAALQSLGRATSNVRQAEILAPGVAKNLLDLEVHLRVARDAGYLSYTLHYVAQDVISELRGLISYEEIALSEGPSHKDDAVLGTNEELTPSPVPHIPQLIKDREAAILMLLKEKNPRRFKELKPYFPVSDRAVRKDLARLVREGRVVRRGQPPQSWYELSSEGGTP